MYFTAYSDRELLLISKYVRLYMYEFLLIKSPFLINYSALL